MVLSLGLAGCSEKSINEETQKDEKTVAEIPVGDASKLGVYVDGKVTEEEYKQIKVGMTPEEVFTIIGSKGTVVSKSGADGDPHNTAIYKFDTASHSPGAEMTFEGDKLSYKAQNGLETTEIETNLEQLNKLEKGMSKENVFEILGGKGALIAESEVLEIYSYNNSASDAETTVLFIDGKFKSSGERKGSR
ncbi:hypothetical protein MKX47_02045 [Solibacillus sp. FSL R7-0668]|uniref:hypothetical protein n=1 Tax=Solibacillus sp. FSL R7-0668 TaxID=2921688 RepID=UPI0030FAD35E